MKKLIFLLIPVLAGCAMTQVSPNITAQPGRGVSLERFYAEDNHCRSIARTSVINGQRSINAIYYQCMWSHGHQVPGRAVASIPPPPRR